MSPNDSLKYYLPSLVEARREPEDIGAKHYKWPPYPTTEFDIDTVRMVEADRASVLVGRTIGYDESAEAAKEEVKTERETIEAEVIHNEFKSAPDEILAEAQAIIDKTKNINTGYLDKLSSLGFKRTAYRKENTKLLEQRNLSEEEAKLVMYYKKTYPTLHFITSKRRKAICEKYGLVMGPVSAYIKNVPEINLDEIIKAQKLLKEKDLIHQYTDRYGDKNSISYKNIPALPDQYLKTVEPHELSIVAPLEDFNRKHLKLNSDYELKYEIKDPVVFQEVNGGYLILTMWGKEATYPEFKGD